MLLSSVFFYKEVPAKYPTTTSNSTLDNYRVKLKVMPPSDIKRETIFLRGVNNAIKPTQLEKVRDLMKDGKYRTLGEVARTVGSAEQSVSARLRDLRKARYGSYRVDKRVGKNGFEYRVTR